MKTGATAVKKNSVVYAAPAAIEEVTLPLDGTRLVGELLVPEHATGVVLYALGSGSIHETTRNELVARELERHGIASLRFPLLTPAEAASDAHSGLMSFDLPLLTHRLLRATHWVMAHPRVRGLGIGYLATGTGAAAALVAAAQLGYAIQAVVSRAGRPDFAGDALARVTAPTLLIVGERDEGVLNLNREAVGRLCCRKRVAIVPGAGHLFDEAGTLEQVATLAADWFRLHLKPARRV